ncbi:hypothetical protein SUGI_0182440 [Cryptomeria japonica]|nr:hypothetical protein SUGI_0182440 [Cryptomeria japonica]
MFGFSSGEVLLLLGATVAVIGPKDVPRIAKAAGRLAGKVVGYVQSGRGQMETVLHQSQATQDVNDSCLPKTLPLEGHKNCDLS